MKRVDLYVKVRRAVLADGMSRRAAARYFGLDLCAARKGELCGAFQIAQLEQIIDKRFVWSGNVYIFIGYYTLRPFDAN